MAESAAKIFEPSSVPKGGVFALGNFDGVHRGHQAVVKTAVEKARGLGVPARVLTLEPHPRAVFTPHLPPFRLTPAPVKLRLLRALGVEDVIVQNFTPEFGRLPARDFVDKILIGGCGIQHAVAGFDFVFGHNREGNMENLRAWLAPHNTSVTEVAPFRGQRGEIMSSSRVRAALQAADLRTAEYILGRPWSITGIVERGAGRGRTIDVPTANIALGEYQRPKFGVYAVHAGLAGKPLIRQGVANIGTRPTVDGTSELLELHMFDFDENIYGQEWEVELVDFIRPEQAFPNIDMLKAQIMHDIDTAHVRLRTVAEQNGALP